MRLLFSILLIGALLQTAGAQYQIMLELGDTLLVSDYQERDDTITFAGGRIGKADVLCIVGGRFIFEYPLPKMKPYIVRKAYDGSPCGRAKQFARKYAKVDLQEYVVHDPSIDSLTQEEWDNCFREELVALGVDAAEHLSADPLVRVTSRENITSAVNLIILRTGDTLRIEKDLYMSKGILNWYGGGAMDPKEVLLVVKHNGQFIIDNKGQFSKLDPQVIDLTPCALGVIMASLYWETAALVSEIPELDQSLRDNDDLAECYYRRQAKFLKRQKVLKTIGTVSSVVTGVNSGIR